MSYRQLILQYIARFATVVEMPRRVYPAKITINGRILERIIIDPHYEEKHGSSVTDEIIIELVELLNKKSFIPVDMDEEGFQYFVNDRMELAGKFYKLVWLLHEQELLIGIVNAYRR